MLVPSQYFDKLEPERSPHTQAAVAKPMDVSEETSSGSLAIPEQPEQYLSDAQ